MKSILCNTIIIYQWVLSPVLAGLGCRCRFHPTCSEYAVEALELYTWPCALVLIAKRVLSCGPWHAGGVSSLKPEGEI